MSDNVSSLWSNPPTFSSNGKKFNFNMESVSNINKKTAQSTGDGAKMVAECISQWTDQDAYDNIVTVVHLLYAYYTCPARKEKYLLDQPDVKPEFVDSQPTKRNAKRIEKIDAFFTKYNIVGQVTNYHWSSQINEFLMAPNGFYQNCSKPFPKHANFLYSKGFWGSLKGSDARELYKTINTHTSTGLTAFAKNPGLKASWLKTKDSWDPKEVEIIYTTGPTPDLEKKYALMNMHIINPLLLGLAFDCRDADGNWIDATHRDFYYTSLEAFLAQFGKQGITYPAGEWTKKDFTLYYETAFKPVNNFCASIRKPNWYDPRNSSSGSAKIRKALGLKKTITGGDTAINAEYAKIKV